MLQRHVIPCVASKWYRLGVELFDEREEHISFILLKLTVKMMLMSVVLKCFVCGCRLILMQLGPA